MSDSLSRLSSQLRTAYDRAGLSERATTRRTIKKFAQAHGLMHFNSGKTAASHMQIIRGTTAAYDQKDTNICIGTHDGYDISFLERTASVVHDGYPSASHRWHIMSFDLHSHNNLPFIFIGTKQQSKTFYAKLFTTRREVRQLDPSFFGVPGHFGAHYTVVASPAEQLVLTQLLTTPVTTTMAKYHYPFAVEIQDDTLYVITEFKLVTDASLTRMMHYGLWLAGHIDQNIK